MAILPERDKQIYPEIKRVGDIVIGIPTQSVQSKHVHRTNPQVCANIALNINSKLDGTNHVINLGEKAPLFREPVIIFGADVTHPLLTEIGIPSIAAIVASMDANATKYCARVRAQNHRNGKGAQERTDDLAGMVYKAKRKLKPTKIILYRDGVSEGQFDQGLVHEVRVVQQACIMLEKDYRPRIAIIRDCSVKTNERKLAKGGMFLLVQQWTVVSHILTSSTFICAVTMESRYDVFAG